MALKIEKAEKSKQKLKLAIAGAAGSGKTKSSIMLMDRLLDKIPDGKGGFKKGKFCVIDTEQQSASLYADQYDYDTVTIDYYSPDVYMEAIKLVEENGYDGCIIDQITHEWSGVGGCLEMVNRAARSSGNSYTAWKDVTPKHEKFLEALIRCKMHLIVTMRSKTSYELVKNDKGKMVPVKLGLEPVQRDGVEYQFTTVFNLNQDHCFTCSKDRTELFNNIEDPIPLTADIATKLIDWLNSGKEIKEEVQKTFGEDELKEALEQVSKAMNKPALDQLKKEFNETWDISEEYRTKIRQAFTRRLVELKGLKDG